MLTAKPSAQRRAASSARARPSRVFVFGPPGCGKTTLSGVLSGGLRIPHIELDALLWGPHWTMHDNTTFLASVRAAADEPRWVIEGTFRSDVAELVWPRADVVVWLDYRFRLVAARLLRRTLRRAVTRQRLWHGNVEPLRDMVGRGSLFAWLRRSFPALPGQVAQFRERTGGGAETTSGSAVLQRFAHPRAAAAWCRQLRGHPS